MDAAETVGARARVVLNAVYARSLRRAFVPQAVVDVFLQKFASRALLYQERCDKTFAEICL